MPHRRRRILRHCQVALTTTAVLALVALLLGFWWLNRNGFAGQWGEKFSAELSQRGVHAQFSSVRFSPLRGLIARDVVIYRDHERKEIIAEAPTLRLDIDRADAIRGELTLRKLILNEAIINLSLSSENDAGHPLTIRNLSGNLRLDRQDRLVLEQGKGTIGNVSFELQAELDHCKIVDLLNKKDEQTESANASFLDILFSEFSRWELPEQSPPHLTLKIQGSLKTPSSIRTSFSFTANQLLRNHYKMENLLIAGELFKSKILLDRLEFSDAIGTLTARADYHIAQKKGRYEAQSTIHLATMLSTCFDIHTLDKIKSSAAPTINVHGEFQHHPDGTSTVALGRLEIPKFRFLDHPYESLSTEFSWEEGDIFLRDLKVQDTKGELTGNILIKGDDIRYRANSTLAVASYSPFIREGSGLAKIIMRASLSESSKVSIDATGWIQRSNLKNWSSEGKAHANSIIYNDVPLKEGNTQFTIDSQGSTFKDIVTTFDYHDYALHKKHGGPKSALVKADEISHDRKTKLTKIANLRGTAWPAPILRLFTPKTADYIERTFHNHQLPSFTAAGIVDRNKKLTDVKAQLKIPGRTDYHFLGEDLRLQNSSFLLNVRPKRVDISNLSFSTFNGTAGGELTVFTSADAPPTFKGGLKWTRLHLPEIGKTYGFEQAKQGLVTGRFDFTGSKKNVRRLNGQGNIGLENGHLFYVPILGPLSAPLGKILGDKRSSHEEARNASCSFAVTNGTFQTSDFLTSTPSSVFTGEGLIDLHRQTIDMTVRMNARGLLGLITLPLRPFNGLFQFRGTGHLNDPVWRNSSFTTPTRGKNDPIFRKPGKAQIVRD